MKRIAIAAAALAVAAVLAGGGVALASIPDSSGTIHGCYSNKTGALRVVSSSTCPSGQTPLAWSQNAGTGQVRRTNEVGFPAGQSPPATESASVSCPSGFVATGGGYFLSGPMGVGGNATEGWTPVYDDPLPGGQTGQATGWEVGLDETGTAGVTGLGYVLNVYVICAPG